MHTWRQRKDRLGVIKHPAKRKRTTSSLFVKKHNTKHRNSTFKSHILYKVTADRRYKPGDIHINSNVQLVVGMLAIEGCHQEGKDADGGDGQLEAAAAAPLQEGGTQATCGMA